jgi:hypothetical protein
MSSIAIESEERQAEIRVTDVLAFPQEMRNVGQWVGWREELRNGKFTKIPINPLTGYNAATNDGSTWSTYEQALHAAQNYNLNGIGFVLTTSTGIVAIDLDNCRDPETGKLTPMAERIVQEFNSYTEISPSGRGVHIYVLGKLPPGKRRIEGIEMYDSVRYMTVTGKGLESVSGKLESRQNEIDALYDWISKDADLVEQAKRDDPQFSLLWDGDTTQYNGDESCADLALCNKLAPRCNYDPVHMDRIFRRSGLMRDKWDEPHSADGRTYGQMTIHRAIEDRGSTECNKASATADKTLRVVNGHEIYMKNLPPTKWYVGNILHEGACLLSGDPKVGKSFLALQIAIAVAGTDESVCGSFKVGQHGPVLYLALDDGSERRIHDRLHQLTDNEDALEQIDFVYQRDLPPLSKGLDDILDSYLTDHKYALVVLDTLGAVLEATNNNRSVYRTEYGEGIKLQKLAQKHGICLLVLHHTNKGPSGNPDSRDAVKRASGTHGLTGSVDGVLLLTREHLTARPRDGEESEYRFARLDNGSWEVDGPQVVTHGVPVRPLNPERQAVKEALASGPKDRTTLAAELGVSDEATRKRLERMASDGLVSKLPDGRYGWACAEAVPGQPVSGLSPLSGLSDCPNCPQLG